MNKFLLRAMVALAVSVSSLGASTIFSVGGSVQNGQYSLNNIEVAVSFIAAANEVVTGGSIVGTGGTFTMKIETNQSGTPSGTTLSGGTGTATLGNLAVYTAVTSLNASLVQGTEYWIVMTGTGSINLSSTAAGTVPNVNGEYNLMNGGGWGTEGLGSGYYLPNVNLTGTLSSAPEPASFSLLIGGLVLVGSGAVRARRK